MKTLDVRALLVLPLDVEAVDVEVDVEWTFRRWRCFNRTRNKQTAID